MYRGIADQLREDGTVKTPRISGARADRREGTTFAEQSRSPRTHSVPG